MMEKLVSKMSPKWRDTTVALVFLSPFLAVYAVFLVYPIFYSMYLSFRTVSVDTDMFNIFSDMRFTGLKNYIELAKDYHFWWSLTVTFYYAILYIPLLIFSSLVLAVLLNNHLKGHSFFRSAYFMPNVLDMFVVGTIWMFLYAPQGGVISQIMNALGIDFFSREGILGSPRTAMLGVVVALVLKNSGFGMILFLAAIQNISRSVYEAADIDGASNWQKFTKITIPLVRPIILFMVVTGMIGALNSFTEIYAMTSGKPNVVVFGKTMEATRVAGYYLFRQWDRMNYGYAAAMSYALLFITLAVSYVNAKILKSSH
ncbi:MAG: sugar ABC transporter permease [Endomicrobiia bacterium]|nr:sugar ABC transporter permease [Endomicrobiia bacterium]